MDRVRYLLGVLTLAVAIAGSLYLFNLLRDDDQSGHFRLNVEFRDVGGLQPGADVKYRGVRVGNIRRVQLRDDGQKGIATIVLDPGNEGLARTNSRFWIVTPRFGGLTGGASGLDTLVRDAYLSFYTPEPQQVQLANGSSITGVEQPYVDAQDSGLSPARRGDLLMTLLAPDTHGLRPGSEVRYRGMRTGEVRSVQLANDGGHVRLALRIDRPFRATVTDKSQFWVARPRLSGALLRGSIDVEDLSALLSPFVSYHTEPGEGLPVSDAHVVAAETERPSITLAKVDVSPDEPAAAPVTVSPGEGLQLVRVIYEAVEEDWLSPNDEIRRESTGLLYEDAEGRVLVVTARSGCDAAYFDRDAFGALPEVIEEGISVQLADGTALRALRTWVAADDVDLAVLVADLDRAERDDVLITAPQLLRFDTPAAGEALEYHAMDVERRATTSPGEPALPGGRGAIAVIAGRAVGVIGQTSADSSELQRHDLALVPEGLRPRQ